MGTRVARRLTNPLTTSRSSEALYGLAMKPAAPAVLALDF
jgi:hypothetical protein